MAIKRILLVLVLLLSFKAIAAPVMLEKKFGTTTSYYLMKEDDGRTGVYFLTKDTVEVYLFNYEDTARQYYSQCLRPSSKKVRRIKGGNGYGVWKGRYIAIYEEKF